MSNLRYRHITAFLSKRREGRGLSQWAVARRLGITQSGLSVFERGKTKRLDIGQVTDYAAMMGLTVTLVMIEKDGTAHSFRIPQEDVVTAREP